MYLHQSTRDNVTNNVSLYTDFVFQSLRGLESCDGVVSNISIRLNPLDQSAFEFVHLLSGGMSENQLLRCDLSNKHLPANLFFFLLSALYQLKVAWLKLDGDNEWASLNSYTNCVIFYLGKHLLYLDEEELTNQRLHLALKAQAESNIKIVRIAWEECCAEGLEAAREHLEALQRAQEEIEEKERIMMHMMALDADGLERGDYDDREEMYGRTNKGTHEARSDMDKAQQKKRKINSHSGDDVAPLTAEEQQKLDEADRKADGDGSSAPGKEDAEKDDATGFNLHVPGRGIGAGPLPGSTVAANSVSTHNSNVGIDTQLSNKLEILIHYLQVYGLVLISSINIKLPAAFDQFSEWVRVFTLNLDSWFSFLPFESNLFFWIVSFFPLLLLLLFWRISRLRGNLDAWVDSYVVNWARTKRQVGISVGAFVLLGVLCSILFMVSPTNVHAFAHAAQETIEDLRAD